VVSERMSRRGVGMSEEAQRFNVLLEEVRGQLRLLAEGYGALREDVRDIKIELRASQKRLEKHTGQIGYLVKETKSLTEDQERLNAALNGVQDQSDTLERLRSHAEEEHEALRKLLAELLEAQAAQTDRFVAFGKVDERDPRRDPMFVELNVAQRAIHALEDRVEEQVNVLREAQQALKAELSAALNEVAARHAAHDVRLARLEGSKGSS